MSQCALYGQFLHFFFRKIRLIAKIAKTVMIKMTMNILNKHPYLIDDESYDPSDKKLKDSTDDCISQRS